MSFETLIHIILEQQVSLASARAAMDRLKDRLRNKITPDRLLTLTDTELKSCYFSRQKTAYARNLATAVLDKTVQLKKYPEMSNETIRGELTAVKGIGNWTVDIFLMMALHRTDLFPLGDIALLNSVRHLRALPANSPKETIAMIAEEWKPLRTIAAYYCWHAYICRKGLRF